MALVLLITVDSIIDAGLISGKLDSEGIVNYQLNSTFTNLMPQFYGMMGAGIQIMVNEDQLEQAQRIIQQKEAEIFCPQCHSRNISVKAASGWNRMKILFILLFLSGPAGNLFTSFLCNDCGYNFKK